MNLREPPPDVDVRDWPLYLGPIQKIFNDLQVVVNEGQQSSGKFSISENNAVLELVLALGDQLPFLAYELDDDESGAYDVAIGGTGIGATEDEPPAAIEQLALTVGDPDDDTAPAMALTVGGGASWIIFQNGGDAAEFGCNPDAYFNLYNASGEVTTAFAPGTIGMSNGAGDQINLSLLSGYNIGWVYFTAVGGQQYVCLGAPVAG